MGDPGETAIDIRAAREALREHLKSRGLAVATDTLGLRDSFYVLGAGDLAKALFEFKPSAAEAVESMYTGSWGSGMPPRFAVMPSCESDSPEMEMLEQMRVIPVLFDADASGVSFRNLDNLLEEHVGA
jgi:hypothetical protein